MCTIEILKYNVREFEYKFDSDGAPGKPGTLQQIISLMLSSQSNKIVQNMQLDLDGLDILRLYETMHI